jgi:HEPN domain-containing protein
MKNPRDHSRGLLLKASSDLYSAEDILTGGRAYDMACFHAQQAVEKSLKALLASADEEYPLRHDLGELLETVKTRFPDLNLPIEEIMGLAPYAVEVRYDDEFFPSHEDAQKALETARIIHRTVTQQVLNPTPKPPPTPKGFWSNLFSGGK